MEVPLKKSKKNIDFWSDHFIESQAKTIAALQNGRLGTAAAIKGQKNEIQNLNYKIAYLEAELATSAVRRDKSGNLVLPSPMSPRTIATKYIGITNVLQTKIAEDTMAAIEPLLAGLRQDDAYTDTTENIFRALEEDILAYIEQGPFETAVAAVAYDALAFSDKKYDRGVYKMVGINNASTYVQRSMAESWIRENVKLIKNINTAQSSQIETLLLRSARDGMAVSAVTKEIQRIIGATANRATLIASDQTYKLDGQIDRFKQQEAGINYYIWRTMKDDRVRSSHMSREGSRRSWENDAPHPGQEVNCRCMAEPDIKSLFGN